MKFARRLEKISCSAMVVDLELSLSGLEVQRGTGRLKSAKIEQEMDED